MCTQYQPFLFTKKIINKNKTSNLDDKEDVFNTLQICWWFINDCIWAVDACSTKRSPIRLHCRRKNTASLSKYEWECPWWVRDSWSPICQGQEPASYGTRLLGQTWAVMIVLTLIFGLTKRWWQKVTCSISVLHAKLVAYTCTLQQIGNKTASVQVSEKVIVQALMTHFLCLFWQLWIFNMA